jgi:ribonuclease P protein component
LTPATSSETLILFSSLWDLHLDLHASSAPAASVSAPATALSEDAKFSGIAAARAANASAWFNVLYPFGRQQRLRKRHEFQRVFDEGRRFQSAPFSLLAAENGLDYNRLGLVVSRKVGPAHIRNLVKRRLRESFRLQQGEFPPGRDYVVVARPFAARTAFSDLKHLLLKAAQTLG